MATKYDELDALILSRIGNTPKTFSDLFGGAITAECDKISEKGYGLVEAFRILDRRLQALRKKGLIASTGKGWVKV